ncbi:SMI1/KNR4 family protein [Proteus hauseri]|uniref:SMI1/KNR4 family protein n=1 Tax=Proteus hauseri TaxID=183417 RepID=UPI0032DA0C18
MGFISSILKNNKDNSPQALLEKINSQNANNTIERIREKLVLVAKIDHELNGFGASKHQYKLNPTLPLEKVKKLQTESGCRFPKDYIDFITQIGNGGAGPYYGMSGFDDEIDRNGIGNCALPCLLSPDMSISEWTALCEVPEDCSDEEFDIICDRVHQGTLYLGTCGCEYDLLLIVNGPYQGHILYTSHWVDSNTPYIFSYETSFLEWYERWLDEVILGYNTSWFGHRMGGDEEFLIDAAKNTDDINKKIDAINALTKLPKLSNNALNYLEQQIETNEITLYKAVLNVLSEYSRDRTVSYIKKELKIPYNEKTKVVIPIIYFKQKENFQLFYDDLLPILKEVDDDHTLSNIGYILTSLNAVRVEDFQPFFTHQNQNIVISAIYAASHDIDLKDKVKYFFENIISSNERISLIAIQSATKINQINDDLLPYLKKAWQMYPVEKDPYIRTNIKSYITKIGMSKKIDVNQW